MIDDRHLLDPADELDRDRRAPGPIVRGVLAFEHWGVVDRPDPFGDLAIERVEVLGDPDELDLGERAERNTLEIVAGKGKRRTVEETLQRVLVLRRERGPETREALGRRVALPGVCEIDSVCELASLVVAAQSVPSRRLDVLLEREAGRLGLHVGVGAQLPVVREAPVDGIAAHRQGARRGRQELARLPGQVTGDEADFAPLPWISQYELVEEDPGDTRPCVRAIVEVRQRGPERGPTRLHDVHEEHGRSNVGGVRFRPRLNLTSRRLKNALDTRLELVFRLRRDAGTKVALNVLRELAEDVFEFRHIRVARYATGFGERGYSFSRLKRLRRPGESTASCEDRFC